MKQSIVYVGLDVDDTQYHGSALPNTLVVWPKKLKGGKLRQNLLHGSCPFYKLST